MGDEKTSGRKAETLDVAEMRSLRFRAVKLVMAEGAEKDKADPFAKAEQIVNFVLGGKTE